MKTTEPSSDVLRAWWKFSSLLFRSFSSTFTGSILKCCMPLGELFLKIPKLILVLVLWFFPFSGSSTLLRTSQNVNFSPAVKQEASQPCAFCSGVKRLNLTLGFLTSKAWVGVTAKILCFYLTRVVMPYNSLEQISLPFIPVEKVVSVNGITL